MDDTRLNRKKHSQQIIRIDSFYTEKAMGQKEVNPEYECKSKIIDK